MGVALQRMGQFYEQMGQTEKQIDAFQRSLSIFNRLLQEHPKEDWNKHNAAISYDSLGEIGREIEPEPGKLFELYSRSLNLRKELVAVVNSPEPTAFQRKRALAVSYIKLAALTTEIGNPRMTRDYATEALASSEAAAQVDPSKQEDRRELMAYSCF